jgi:centromere-localized protein 2
MADAELPSEGEILRATLLPPSSLPTVISLKDFTALFPADLRIRAQIPALYRALQHQRTLDLDFVRENITAEAKRGDRQQYELLRSKINGTGGAEELDVDIAAEDRGVADTQDAHMDGVVSLRLFF